MAALRKELYGTVMGKKEIRNGMSLAQEVWVDPRTSCSGGVPDRDLLSFGNPPLIPSRPFPILCPHHRPYLRDRGTKHRSQVPPEVSEQWIFAGLDSIFSGQCSVCADSGYNHGYRSYEWKLETLEGLREFECQRCAFIRPHLLALCSRVRAARLEVVFPISLELFWFPHSPQTTSRANSVFFVGVG